MKSYWMMRDGHWKMPITHSLSQFMRGYAHILFVFVVLLCGCAAVGELPEKAGEGEFSLVRDVPFFPQEDYQCGPASLAGVLNYWGVSVSPGEVAKAIYSQSAKDTLNLDMLLYARSRGLEASQYSGDLKDLRKRIDSGQPLIVLVDYGFSVFQANHFMVVVGYDENGVVANSGRYERKVVPLEDFMKSWKRTKYWTLLIKRK